MEIESRVGEGTRATVHLPFDCEAARPRGEALPRVVPLVSEARPEPRLEARSDMTVKKSA